jgi:hypothetical protein
MFLTYSTFTYNQLFPEGGWGGGSSMLFRSRVDVSPTDVSLTENSWMLRPFNKASLGYCVPDQCVPTLDRVKHETSSVGRYRGLGRPPAPNKSVGVWPASPTPLTRFIDWRPSVGCTLGPHIELHRFAALNRAAVGSRVSLRSIKSKGWDGSVRGKITKGHFVQGMQHPRIFGRGHIGRGWTNIAPLFLRFHCSLPIRCF